MTESKTPRTDAWCELAVDADVSAVLDLAKGFERELSATNAALADNERWMREVLTDWKVPFDNHLQGLRLAFTQFMFDQNQKNL